MPDLPPPEPQWCLGFGAYTFLAASRAVKNTQPPTAIQSTLGSHPCRGIPCLNNLYEVVGDASLSCLTGMTSALGQHYKCPAEAPSLKQ